MDCLQPLLKEMEVVAKQGGFEFKETLMSGDKESANGEPHKVNLRSVTFPRAVKPKEAVVGKPMLMIFGDGSTTASCALAYLRWQMADGMMQC